MGILRAAQHLAPAAVPADSPDPLPALDTVLRQAVTLTRAALDQAASLDPARVRAQIAEAEAGRRRAEAAAVTAEARAGEAAAERARAARAEQLLDTERADRRHLTTALTAPPSPDSSDGNGNGNGNGKLPRAAGGKAGQP